MTGTSAGRVGRDHAARSPQPSAVSDRHMQTRCPHWPPARPHRV